MQLIQVDEQILAVLVKSTRDGLSMAGIKPIPIGVNKYFQCKRAVSAIVGFVGPTSGSVVVNMSEECACMMAGRLLGEETKELSTQTVDGVCEIANIIAGQTKAMLSSTEHKFDRISIPSIVVGTSYFIRNYRGMKSITVEFEIPDQDNSLRADLSFTVSMCMMKI